MTTDLGKLARRAKKILDLTTDLSGRGPKTCAARQRLVDWFRLGTGSIKQVKADVATLRKTLATIKQDASKQVEVT